MILRNHNSIEDVSSIELNEIRYALIDGKVTLIKIERIISEDIVVVKVIGDNSSYSARLDKSSIYSQKPNKKNE